MRCDIPRDKTSVRMRRFAAIMVAAAAAAFAVCGGAASDYRGELKKERTIPLQ